MCDNAYVVSATIGSVKLAVRYQWDDEEQQGLYITERDGWDLEANTGIMSATNYFLQLLYKEISDSLTRTGHMPPNEEVPF
jgi:hypothetical protein